MHRLLRLLSCGVVLLWAAARACACPFCVSEMQTLSEELAGADAAVIARLLQPATLPELTEPEAAAKDGAPMGTIDPETGEARFRVESTLKGDDLLVGIDEFSAIYFGEADFTKSFLVRGIGDPIDWAIPLELSPLAVDYVQQLQSLPAAGPDRLAFFQPYLEHDDRQLAQDAYDEFARAPYDDLRGLKDRMDLDRILEMINRPQISPSRRRLFFVMLSVCGAEEHVPMLEAFLESDDRVLVPITEAMVSTAIATGGPMSALLTTDVVRGEERRRKLGLDAMTACYLTLTGEDGLDLIDRRFLANTNADQTHIYSTLMSLRFLAEEPGTVSRDRLLQSARLLLDNDTFADQVITDLARWEDWSVLEKLGEMYRQAFEGEVSKYVCEPIVTFLDVAAEQPGDVAKRANELLAELEPLDPETFRRARSLRAFGFLGRARPVERSEEDRSEEQPIKDVAAESDAEQQDDLPPDPASFGARADVSSTPMVEASPAEELAAEDEPTEPPVQAAATRPTPPAGATPLVPPSRWTLIGAPILAGCCCFGLFWFLLRGGA